MKQEKQNLRRQKRPFPIEKEIEKRREFSDREVGITHPDLSSFIRLNDQGDIEIFAAPGIGIVISARSKSVSLFGDAIRFFSKEDGLRWNSYNFNYSASSYVEPTLVKINQKTIHSAVNGVYHFLDRLSDLEQEEEPKIGTINPNYVFGERAPEVVSQKYSSMENYEGLTLEQIGLVEAYSSDFSQQHINMIIGLLKEGYDFQQAHQKALRDLNE
jgi:hypothetical protein